MTCDRCYQPVHDETEHGVGLCPYEARRRAPVVWADAIPGGIEIAHGLCHADGTPRRFDSRSEIKAACEVKGLVPWSDIHAEDSLKDARVKADWQRSSEAQRQKADRDEMRRAGIRPTHRPASPPQSSPEQRAKIRQIVAERLRALQ